MKVSRALGTSAAAAVMILAPQAAYAADGYGATGTGTSTSGSVSSSSTLPSTGSSALDEVIGGAGLLLLLGGGATLVAARRRKAHPA